MSWRDSQIHEPARDPVDMIKVVPDEAGSAVAEAQSLIEEAAEHLVGDKFNHYAALAQAQAQVAQAIYLGRLVDLLEEGLADISRSIGAVG